MISKESGVQYLRAYSDSQLIVGHVCDEYETREENMKKYISKVKNLIRAFRSFDIQHIPRVENAQAKALARLATCAPPDLCAQVFFEMVEERSIKKSTSVLQLDSEPCWIDPLIFYFHDGTLAINWKEARSWSIRPHSTSITKTNYTSSPPYHCWGACAHQRWSTPSKKSTRDYAEVT